MSMAVELIVVPGWAKPALVWLFERFRGERAMSALRMEAGDCGPLQHPIWAHQVRARLIHERRWFAHKAGHVCKAWIRFENDAGAVVGPFAAHWVDGGLWPNKPDDGLVPEAMTIYPGKS